MKISTFKSKPIRGRTKAEIPGFQIKRAFLIIDSDAEFFMYLIQRIIWLKKSTASESGLSYESVVVDIGLRFKRIAHCIIKIRISQRNEAFWI